MVGVIAGHCYLIPIGWAGVWLFYTISGFVIMRGFTNSSREQESRGSRYVGFLNRRFWRIVPLYALYIVVVGGIGLGIDAPSVVKSLPYLASFTYNWYLIVQYGGEISQWFPLLHLWSLSVEQQFYMIFPLLVIFLPRTLHVKAMITMVVLAVVARIVVNTTLGLLDGTPLWKSFTVYFAAPCHFDSFAGGALVAIASQRLEPASLVKAKRALGLLLSAAGGAYAVAYVTIGTLRHGWGMEALQGVIYGNMYGEGREVFLYSIVAMFSAWLLMQTIQPTVVSNLLRHRWLCWVGRVSYGGYVFHGFALWLFASALDVSPETLNTISIASRLGLFAAVLAMSLVLAGLSFKYFEEPVRRSMARGRTRVAT